MFKDQGPFSGCMIPRGYQLIQVHTIFDVNVDRRHEVSLVTDRHLTATPSKSVYSGVVSLRDFRMCLFIGELDGMTLWATDIRNAYLKAITSEKICIRAGPEFGDLKGHWLNIYKALHGLQLKGKAFKKILYRCLLDLKFVPSLAELSIYTRKCPTADHYKNIVTYITTTKRKH